MTIRVCWIIPTLDEGGAEKQLCYLATRIDRRRFSPTVVTLTRDGPRRATLDSQQIPVISIGKKGKADPLAFRRLRRALSELQPDVVHTWLFAANSYGRMAALRSKVPVIFGGERCVDPWKSTWHNVIDRFLARRTSGLITNSHGVVDFYEKRGIARGHFHVIPNGIEARTEDTRISREEFCRRLSLEPDHFIIGTVGRLWKQKGHEDMIWAGEMMRVLHSKVTLLIVGDGPERERLEMYCDQVRAAKQVRFLGHRSDVSSILPHFDLYWNASHYEGQSNSILEAMQAGVPVVATDIPGNRDLIEHEVNGLLVPFGDVGALMKQSHRLIEDRAFGQRLSENSRLKIARDYSVDTMVHAHMTLYEEFVDRHRAYGDMRSS